MDPRLWVQAKQVFGATMALSEDERDAFVRSQCAGDRELEQLVRRLVDADRALPEDSVSRPFQPDTLLAGHYRILGPVGRGGMGIVYAAQDVLLQRRVALKFLPGDLSRDPQARDRFRREARAASSLDHPNICSIHEIDETDDGQAFIVMAFYEGQTLASRIDSGLLSADEAVDICLGVANGLERAHAAGILHRDIKPANVMITLHGEVKILDFGLARAPSQVRLSRAGQVMGTVAYMSPEQLRGEDVDHRTDIWSFGVMLYESLTGRLPFAGEREETMMRSILEDEPQPLDLSRPDLPPELAPVLDRALAKESVRRYSGVRMLSEDLRRAVGRSEIGSAVSFVDQPTAPSRRTVAWVVTALFLISLLVFFTMRAVAPVAGGKGRPLESLVVLPLENLSQDPSQDYFVDGLTEALIAEMGRIGALRVISRTSSMVYRDTDLRLSEIARDLNVDGVIEGTVFKVGDQIQVSTRLLRADPEELLWNSTYQRSLSDVLGIMSSIAREVAGEVRIVLTPDEQTRLESARPLNLEAHDAYLRGRYIWFQKSIDGVSEAKSLFEQAIEIDPGYAAPYSGLADIYPALYHSGDLPRQKAYSQAREYARTAIELDPYLAEAYTSLMRISIGHDWNWEAAERYAQRALELNPSYALAHHWYAHLLLIQGRFDAALTSLGRAQELNPAHSKAAYDRITFLYWARRYDEAIEEGRKVLAAQPQALNVGRFLGLAYLGKGQIASAVEVFEGNRLAVENGHLASAYALAGRTREAEELLDRMADARPRRIYLSAVVYVSLGRHEEALSYLERSFREGSSSMALLRIDPRLDPLRSDVRFQALIEAMNFPERDRGAT